MVNPLPVLLISGCSSGIGWHCAHEMANLGWSVYAGVRNMPENATKHPNICWIRLDVNENASIAAAVAKIIQKEGRIDALFNNAGFGQPGALEDVPRDAMKQQFETNVFGALALTQAVLPIMRKQNHGKILFNSSILGFIAMPYRGAYNASKFALEGIADTFRLELMDTKIKVSLIEPGPILSNFRKNALAQFYKNIHIPGSPHENHYQSMLARLQTEGEAAPFTLGPEAVQKALWHALNSKNPKIRYRVTLPTHVFAFLKRLLSSRMMDYLQLWASGDGKR